MSADGEYGLVMPFVVVQSAGGELDDRAFTVGVELGALDAELHACANLPSGHIAIPSPRYLHSVGIPQADLIAMRHGFALTAEPWDDDDSWTLATFSRPDVESPSVERGES